MNSTTSTATPERNVTAFFILVIVMSIPLYILAALVPEEMVLFLAVTLAPAPITAALILTYRETGSEGARRLLRRSFDYRRITRKSWYVPIFFLVPVLFFLALGLMVLMGEPVPEPLFPVVAAPVAFLAFFLFALFEEVGWMGYAFDPMQGRRPALTASILLGIPWALWHLPFYLFSGLDPLWIAGQLFALLAIRLLIAWIYNNTGKSIFATILFHAVYNVCTLAMPSYYSSLGHALTSVLLVIAAGVVIFLWGPETLAQFKFKNKEQVHQAAGIWACRYSQTAEQTLAEERQEICLLEPTSVTWILVVFGLVFIFLLLLYAQILMALRPHSQKARDILIGQGEDWRNETHFRMSHGAAWADLVIWLPLLAAGSAGVLMGQAWGYALWAPQGAISVYISIILWFTEREYVYPAQGPLLYYTVYWGFFVYWGLAVMVYAALRLAGVTF